MISQSLPEPVIFHPLKHHLQYIRQFISQADLINSAELRVALSTVGSSQLDFYTGELSPHQISQETIAFLKRQNLLTPEAYKVYLTASGDDFKIISLSDESDWVLRWGLAEKRYVHLHPARYAKNTMRVKATALKTAIATFIVSSRTQRVIDLHLINSVRKEWLSLPPMKEQSVSLAELISLIAPDN